jgi:hypothetical protein
VSTVTSTSLATVIRLSPTSIQARTRAIRCVAVVVGLLLAGGATMHVLAKHRRNEVDAQRDVLEAQHAHEIAVLQAEVREARDQARWAAALAPHALLTGNGVQTTGALPAPTPRVQMRDSGPAPSVQAAASSATPVRQGKAEQFSATMAGAKSANEVAMAVKTVQILLPQTARARRSEAAASKADHAGDAVTAVPAQQGANHTEPQEAVAVTASRASTKAPLGVRGAAPSSPDNGDQLPHVEAVSQSKAQVDELTTQAVKMKSGLSIPVGGTFPSGEKLLGVDPAKHQIVTDQRTIVLMP